MFKALTPHGYTLTLEAPRPGSGLPDDRLSEIKVPTLCIVGDEDPALEDVKFVHSQIEGSELVMVPNAGHFANLDQTEIFNRETLAFLAKVDALRAAAVA